jgi:DNA-binding protein Fis
MKMPELSLAKRALDSRKILSSFEFSADQIEAVRHLIGRTIAEVECELIIETLTDQRGSRTEAAKVLGISIRTLRNKIHEYDERGKIVPKPAAQWVQISRLSVPWVGHHDGRKTIHSCERSCIEGGELLSGLPQHSHFITDKIFNGWT